MMSFLPFKKSAIAVLVAQTLAVTSTPAATIVVSNGGDTGTGCTLREAVTSINFTSLEPGCANTGAAFGSDDRITFSSSVTSVALGMLALRINKTVSISGGSGVAITGNGLTPVIKVSAYTEVVKLDQLTLSGGGGDSGGGAYVETGASMALSNSTVTGNTTNISGGGIYVAAFANATLSNVIVSGNASYFGGGMYAGYGSSLQISNSTISGNAASSTSGTSGIAGGLFSHSGTVSIQRSTISGNTAQQKGGGIFSRGGKTMTVLNTTISENAAYIGGGIYALSNVDIGNSTVSANSAYIGGGIFAGTSSWSGVNTDVLLANSTVSNNGAFFIGGIDVRASSRLVLNASIVANSGNGDCAKAATASIVSLNESIGEDGSCGSARAVDPMLRPLAKNGGPTNTHALLAGSPAIDKESNVACAGALVLNRDQRGESRPAGERCDVGAYEFGAETTFFVIPAKNNKTVIFGL